MKIFVLYNFERKSTEDFSEIIGVFETMENAEKELRERCEKFQARCKNPEYYGDEYKDGYYMTVLLSGYDLAFVSKNDDAYYNAYRVYDFDIPDGSTMAFIVNQQVAVSNPKKCSRGPVEAFNSKADAINFIGCDMRDSYIAIDNDYFGNDFDELVSDSNENTIESTMGYFINWEIESFYVNF